MVVCVTCFALFLIFACWLVDFDLIWLLISVVDLIIVFGYFGIRLWLFGCLYIVI